MGLAGQSLRKLTGKVLTSTSLKSFAVNDWYHGDAAFPFPMGNLQPVGKGTPGQVAVRIAGSPLYFFQGYWQQETHSIRDGYYLTGDAGYKDADGYLYIMSRIDDVINVAGHRLSTGAMEEVLASHQDVAECAVIGVADQLKGELPLGLVVLKAGVAKEPAQIAKELVNRSTTLGGEAKN